MITPFPASPSRPKTSGAMLDQLEAKLGHRKLQEEISDLVVASPPGRLRMDCVAELWERLCGESFLAERLPARWEKGDNVETWLDTGGGKNCGPQIHGAPRSC